MEITLFIQGAFARNSEQKKGSAEEFGELKGEKNSAKRASCRLIHSTKGLTPKDWF